MYHLFGKKCKNPLEKAIFSMEESFAVILRHLRRRPVSVTKAQLDEISLLSQDFYRQHVLLEYQLRQIREQAEAEKILKQA